MKGWIGGGLIGSRTDGGESRTLMSKYETGQTVELGGELRPILAFEDEHGGLAWTKGRESVGGATEDLAIANLRKRTGDRSWKVEP